MRNRFQPLSQSDPSAFFLFLALAFALTWASGTSSARAGEPGGAPAPPGQLLPGQIVYTDGAAVYVVDRDSGVRRLLAQQPAQTVAVGGDGRILFASGSEIFRVLNDGTGAVTKVGGGNDGQPTVVDMVAANGRLYFTDGATVYACDEACASLDSLRRTGTGRSVAVDADGIVFFDYFGGIRGIDPLTGTKKSLRGGSGFRRIRDMAVRPGGEIVYTDGRAVYGVSRKDGRRRLLAQPQDANTVGAGSSGEVAYNVGSQLFVLAPDGVKRAVPGGEGYARVRDLAVVPDVLRILSPAQGQLSEPGELEVIVLVPRGVDPGSVALSGSGAITDVQLGPGVITATMAVPTAGDHFVEARQGDVRATVRLQAIALENADQCEVLNTAACMLPFPSSRYLEEVGSLTRTGYRLNIPQASVPKLNGPDIDPSPVNIFDGFSPVVQILMHIPGGVHLGESDAPVLLEPGCCGQSQQTPYVGVRTQDERSLESDSPSVLIDADTGERVLHFLEPDARAKGDASRETLIMRPGLSLVPGHRYIVAVRGLRNAAGELLAAEAPFAALRDGKPSTIDALEVRRKHFEDVFGKLDAAGVERDDLQLAFDFVVRSDEQLTHQMLAIRDQTFDILDRFPLVLEIDEEFTDANYHPDCQETGELLWRRVRGTFRSPFFLDGNPFGFVGVQFLNVDENGTPVATGSLRVDFDIAVPCSALEEGAVANPLLLGHGLFGRGRSMIDGIQGLVELGELFGGEPFDYIAGATDWRGLSSLDVVWVGVSIIGGIGSNETQLNNYPSFTARLMQGMANTLALTRLMKTGRFNESEYFQRVPGDPSTGVFPGDDAEMFYYGISLGGVMGLYLSALTPDIEKFGIDVGSMNFSMLLQRSTQFIQFEALLRATGLRDPMETLIGTGLLHEQWVSSEPGAYARHITGLVDDPLPGVPPKKILMQIAWLDKQVSNQASEITARTLGIPNLEGSLLREMPGIPDVADDGEGVDNAYVIYDTGSFDVFDPAFDPHVPPLSNTIPSSVCDPHGARPGIPAGILQLRNFIKPGGKIRNFCTDDGVCNVSAPIERPAGQPLEALCDPLN